LAAKIRRYLPDAEARSKIAAAGHARAARDGYYNDRQVELIVARMRGILPQVRAAAGKAQTGTQTATHANTEAG
jgi:spore maturation protein CgeB